MKEFRINEVSLYRHLTYLPYRILKRLNKYKIQHKSSHSSTYKVHKLPTASPGNISPKKPLQRENPKKKRAAAHAEDTRAPFCIFQRSPTRPTPRMRVFCAVDDESHPECRAKIPNYLYIYTPVPAPLYSRGFTSFLLRRAECCV